MKFNKENQQKRKTNCLGKDKNKNAWGFKNNEHMYMILPSNNLFVMLIRKEAINRIGSHDRNKFTSYCYSTSRSFLILNIKLLLFWELILFN